MMNQDRQHSLSKLLTKSVRLLVSVSRIYLFHQSRQKNNKSHPKDRPSNAKHQSHLFWQ